MALSGKIQKDIRSDLSIYIQWDAIQNKQQNYSDVTAKLYINRTYSMYSRGTGYIILDGKRVDGTYNIQTSSGMIYKVCEVSKRIEHSQDGTGSFNVEGSVDFRSTNLSGQIINAVSIPKKSVELNKIERLVDVDFNDFVLSSSTTVNVKRTNEDYYADIDVYVNGVYVKSYSDVTESFDLSFSSYELDKIYKNMSDSVSVPVRLKVVTRDSDDSKIGESSVTRVGRLPNSQVDPTISSVSIVDSISKNWDKSKLLAIVSRPTFKITGYSFKKGATFGSMKVEISGNGVHISSTVKSLSYTCDSPFNAYSSYTATFSLFDSRGNSTTYRKSFTVTPYTKPTLESVKASRGNHGGEKVLTGTYLILEFLVSGTNPDNNNPLNFDLSYKFSNNPTATRHVYKTMSLTYTGDVKKKSVKYVYGTFELSSSYDFTVKVSDRFYSSSVVVTLPSAKMPLVFSRNSVGLGGFPKKENSDIVQVLGDMTVEGKLTINGEHNVSEAYVKPVSKDYIKTYSPTLLNGWNGNLKIQQDGFGNAHIYGKIAPGNVTKWSVIAKLDSNVRPPFQTVIGCVVINSSTGTKTSNALVISADGNLMVAVTSIKGEDQVSFNLTYHTVSGW